MTDEEIDNDPGFQLSLMILDNNVTLDECRRFAWEHDLEVDGL